MQPGEFRYNSVNNIMINKNLMSKLYVSALYWKKNKYTLEVLAPIDLITKHEVSTQKKFLLKKLLNSEVIK